MRSLKEKSIRGGSITLCGQGVQVTIQLVSVAVLARLLTPDDYGVIAMVTAITGFAALFRDLGLSSAAIQVKTLSHGQQSNLFWLNVAAGTVLTCVVAAGAPLIAAFYEDPRLVNVTLVLSLSLLIASVSTQHKAQLTREMRFGLQAVAAIAGALTNLIIAIILAIADWGYWALILGTIGGSLATTLTIIFSSRFRPSFFAKRQGIRELVGFGVNVSFFNVINYVARNLDNVLIGKFVGPVSLGLYSRAYRLLLFPITNLRGPIQTVAFPALSSLQDNPRGFRSYYLKITSVLALLSMPLMAFLFVVSESVVILVLGPNWSGVVPIFSWLAVAGFIQPAVSMGGTLLLSLGRSRRLLFCGLVNTTIQALAMIIGVQGGVTGLAAAYALSNYLIIYPFFIIGLANTAISIPDFLSACAFPAITSLMAAGVALSIRALISDLPDLWSDSVAAIVFWLSFIFQFYFSKAGRAKLATASNLLRSFKANNAAVGAVQAISKRSRI